MLKRVFDILVSGTALLVLSPILLVVIAILIVMLIWYAQCGQVDPCTKFGSM